MSAPLPASLLPRAKHVRHFLRDVVEVVDEPRPPKRLKLTDFQTASRAVIKPRLPEVKPFSGKIEMVPDLKRSGREETRPVREKAVPAETQRKDKPVEETAKTVERQEPKPAAAPQKPTAPPATALPKAPQVASFFVAAGSVAPDAFIDDSGFLGGEDDSSEGEASAGEASTPPPANPFFSSGSLFTKLGSGAPLLGKQDEGGKQTGLFAGTAGANVFASFSSPSPPSSSLFPSHPALFPFSTPPAPPS